MDNREETFEAREFSSLRISLASPEQIRSWSYGEVTKPETINYRRLRPEKDGLFCEAIFGPTKDWQCYCGKYKNVRYRGIVCEKCQVEVTRSAVRRERMGHIELAAPVAHIWYTRRVPSYLGILLDVSKRNMDRVLYFALYVITYVDEEARQKALKRLNDDLQRRRTEIDSVAQASITSLQERLSTEATRLEAEIANLTAQFDEQLAGSTEEIMQEGQKLQRQLEKQLGQATPAAITLKFSGAHIVDEGEVVGREHLTLLNGLLREHLGQVESDLRAQRDARTAPLEADLEAWRGATNEEIQRINEQAAQDIARLQDEIDEEREELLGLAVMQFLNEPRLRELKQKWGQVFRAAMGAEAFNEILSNMELDKLAKDLWHEIHNTGSQQRRKKATKRLRVVEALRKSNNRPEWMILKILPVIPPDLRPMVQLDGGRFATSDLNDLYRRVINRNNRLKRLLELGAPDVIVRNEKRMLQEAVDSLIDNSQRGKAVSLRGRRELKSLSDMLKGKKGRFRRNLLGKRVDYSGRSVIVIGPDLKLHQCGLPKTMALELYRPFVISKLVEYNYASNVKAAKRIIERERPEVWEVLEEVIGDRPVLLNRAPTLHRLGIQAFEPVLVEGKAIQIHPLVCAAFNADFDGDQMAVHVPLGRKAVEEARKLMLATRNLLKPADGQPVVGPTKDMCLGVYYMTMDGSSQTPDGKLFTDLDEVELAYRLRQVDIHARIKVLQIYDDGRPAPTTPTETTVGRCLFNRIVPNDLRFVNRVLDKGGLQKLVARCYQMLGRDATTDLVDRIKNIGFQYATVSGVTIAISDLKIPEAKSEIIDRTSKQVSEIDRQYRRGLLTEDEQYARTIELWSRAREEVSDAVSKVLDLDSPVSIMAQSGASKGGFQPIAQLAGMRGLMADPAGRIINLPIISNLREGLTALEYFISTHGSRKGLADTALRTADAGYLTRRLVDVAQDVIVNAADCETEEGIWIHGVERLGGQSLGERIIGRLAAAPLIHPQTGEVILERNQEITEETVEALEAAGIDDVYVRSPATCRLQHGICAACYGRDLARGTRVAIGAAVGIVAAQSIGEPGTQLTLRTFHTGGVASGGDITVGLPRVEELFEARKTPKGEAEISDISGVVHVAKLDGMRRVIVVDSEMRRERYEIPEGWKVEVEDGEEVGVGSLLLSGPEEENVIHARHKGRVQMNRRELNVIYERRDEREYDIPQAARLLVSEGQRVEAGTQLYEGTRNPHRILRVLGREATQNYLLSEVQKVYRSQGVNINDKHFEIIVRRMLNRVVVVESGSTELLPGDLIDRLVLEEINARAVALGGQAARGRPVLLGITKASLSTDSFLSASSFQHTIKVLAGAAIEGKKDPLYGLKENVIIGKLIPAGTGYRGNIEESDGPIQEFEGVEISLGRLERISNVLLEEPTGKAAEDLAAIWVNQIVASGRAAGVGGIDDLEDVVDVDEDEEEEVEEDEEENEDLEAEEEEEGESSRNLRRAKLTSSDVEVDEDEAVEEEADVVEELDDLLEDDELDEDGDTLGDLFDDDDDDSDDDPFGDSFDDED